VGGNPWLSIWRVDSAWPGVTDAIATARALKERCGVRPVVFVTLQFGLAPHEQLEPLAELITLGSEQFEFWVRLHPMMLAERDLVRRYLHAPDNCLLDESSDLPLQALLPQADLHLTHSSSSVIEAVQCGVPSLLYSDWGRELFEDQVAEGTAWVETGGPSALLARLASMRNAGLTRTATEVDPAEALDRLLARSTESR
jgi:hypothetical protein